MWQSCVEIEDYSIAYLLIQSAVSLRRNSLVDQVGFLGLTYTFVTVSPSNVQNIYANPAQKKYEYSSRDKKILPLLRKCYVIITDLAISLVFITFWE